jgi:hypothetical protein
MLVVRKSRLAGKGLFTTSLLRCGDVIVEYTGERLTYEECEKRYGKNFRSDVAPYVFYVSKKNCVDARDPENLARYANDANGPAKKGVENCAEFAVIKGRPYIVATKDIKPNSEIYVNYGDDYWP